MKTLPFPEVPILVRKNSRTDFPRKLGSFRRRRSYVRGAICLVGCALLLQSCATDTDVGTTPSSPSPEHTAARLPESEISFQWHSIPQVELDSPAVDVVRAQMESEFVTGQNNYLPYGYPGFSEFSAPLDRLKNTDPKRYGTIEFVLVDLRAENTTEGARIETITCQSNFSHASEGNKTGQSVYLFRSLYLLEGMAKEQALSGTDNSWDDSTGRSLSPDANVFEGVRNLHLEAEGDQSIFSFDVIADDEAKQECLDTLTLTHQAGTTNPPVLPFFPGWPTSPELRA